MDEIEEFPKRYSYQVTGMVEKTLAWRIDRTIRSKKRLKKNEVIEKVIDDLDEDDADDDFDHSLKVKELVEEITPPSMEQIMRKRGAPTLFPL